MISLIRRRHLKRNKGFTLLELIFVASILVIITALAIPRFTKTFNSLRLKNFVSDIVSFVRYAQANAITGGDVNRVFFDVEKRSVKVERMIASETEDPNWHPERSKPIPDLIKIESADTEEGIRFYPDGTADEATIEIKDSFGGRYAVSIEASTGYVKVEEEKQ